MGVSENAQYRVAFATNGVAHHITELCYAFLANEKIKEFVLIITTDEQSIEYKRLGRDDYIDHQRVQIIDIRKDIRNAENIINNFDLVIGTFYVDKLLRTRIKQGKVTFIFSERIFKKYDDLSILNTAKNFLRFLKYKKLLLEGQYYRHNVYYLTAGKHATNDYRLLGIKGNKTIMFGYFPQGVIAKREENNMHPTIHLIWVGRLVRWKHPEYAINTYKYLRGRGGVVDLTIIGNGEREEYIRHLASQDDKIYILGGLPTKEVRNIMRKCDILLFTSNGGEGWGMVLNEGMAEGLVPVASYSAGSTTELVEDGVNGFIYYNDNVEELYKKTEILVRDYSLILRMREKCYETISNKWNANRAVSTLIDHFVDITEMKNN